jgi:hypothetical protein
LGSAVVPAAADVDCFGRTRWIAYTPVYQVVASLPHVSFDDGARLRNPLLIEGVAFAGTPTTHPFVRIDQAYTELFLTKLGCIVLGVGSTVPAAEIVSVTIQMTITEGAALVNNQGPVTNGVVSLDTTGVCVLWAYVNPVPLVGGSFQGVVGSVVAILHDASQSPPAQPLLLGTLSLNLIDKAASVSYDDALVSPPLGAAQVQGAIDALKADRAPFPFILTPQDGADYASIVATVNSLAAPATILTNTSADETWIPARLTGYVLTAALALGSGAARFYVNAGALPFGQASIAGGVGAINPPPLNAWLQPGDTLEAELAGNGAPVGGTMKLYVPYLRVPYSPSLARRTATFNAAAYTTVLGAAERALATIAGLVGTTVAMGMFMNRDTVNHTYDVRLNDGAGNTYRVQWQNGAVAPNVAVNFTQDFLPPAGWTLEIKQLEATVTTDSVFSISYVPQAWAGWGT